MELQSEFQDENFMKIRQSYENSLRLLDEIKLKREEAQEGAITQ